MKLKVEIANDPYSRERGLMYRKSLPENEGMIFSFNYPKKMSFWGMNTYIPLDIAFVNENNEIVEIKEIVPLSTKAVRCDTPCVHAVEANSSFFSNNEISIGDKIEIEDNVVTFKSNKKEN